MCVGVSDTPPHYVCLQNVQRKPKRSRPNGLKDLLLMAVSRMSFQGVSVHTHTNSLSSHLLLSLAPLTCSLTHSPPSQTELFQQDVHEEIASHYREYIFHPMHLGMIKRVSCSTHYVR